MSRAPSTAANAKPAQVDPRLDFDRLSDSTLLTLGETARVLGMAESTLKCWRRDGKGPIVIKLGRSIRFPVGELRRFLRDRRQAS